MVQSQRKLFILDTNVLLHDPLAVYSFEEHDVMVPMPVLEELDRIKDRHKDVARDARVAIRSLETCFTDASPEEISAGVQLKAGGATELGCLSIFADHQLKPTGKELDPHEPDHRIINTALYQQDKLEGRDVVLVTKDINMRLKAKGAGLKFVEDYRTDQLVDDIHLLAKGYREIEGDFWQQVEVLETIQEGRNTIYQLKGELFKECYANQYLLDNSEEFAGHVLDVRGEYAEVLLLSRDRLMGRRAWGIHPRNIHQGMALDALLDPEIDMVILTGPAGSGKTLLAMAAALELVVERAQYDKIIVTRNTPEIAESIGFLPGTEEEKMLPWLAAITDTLEALHKNDESTAGSLDYIQQKANIQFKSVNFMRGRSIQNTFVLLDECQNLTPSQLKTIITRCGEGTKLICSGNLAQIDSSYLTAVTSGLTYIVERFKNFDGSSNVFLGGVERSRLAKFAEENL